MAVKPIPSGYHTITPYLIVRGAHLALDFYQKAFGAKEVMRLAGPGGKVAHAEMRIGDSAFMLGEEMPEMGIRSPQTVGGSAVSLLVYVEDVDARFRQAIAAGGKEIRPVKDQFYGDRSGAIEDPFGHHWSLATHKEDVEPAELNRRFEAMMKQGQP